MGATDLDLTCPACRGALRPHTLVVEDRYRLLLCRDCGSQCFRPDPELVRRLPPQEHGEYWEEYKFSVYGSPAVQAAFEDRYASVVQDARRTTRPLQSVLDAGCGVGNFLDWAGRAGLQAVGSDVDASAVAQARERGLQAHVPGELDAAVPDASVDALSLWDVVEHLTEPAEVLSGLLVKVRPGGAVLFETPDGGFPVRRLLLGAHRASRGRLDLTAPMYYYEHKIYFTERGLRRLLDRVGVDLVAVRRETSVREKMSAEFAHNDDGTLLARFLRRGWPALETAARRTGNGNKLLAVGRKR